MMSTLTKSKYSQLSREELIRLLEARDKEQKANVNRTSSGFPNIKRIISEVLVLLFNEEEQPIEKSMRLLLNFFEADWGYVAIFEEDGKTADFPCEVMSEWVEVPKEDHSELTYETIPWIMDTVKAGRDIIMCSMEDLPPEAHVDKQLLEMQRLKSMLIIPLSFHNQVKGFIGFDSVRVQRFWTSDDIEDLHIIARMFSIIIERLQTQNSLEESRKHLSELSTKFKQFFNNLPVGVELYDAEGFLVDLNEADARMFGTTREDLLGIDLFANPAIPPHILTNVKHGQPFSFPLVYDFSAIQNTSYYSSAFVDQIKYLQIKGIGLDDPEFGRVGYLVIISDNTDVQLKAEQTKNNLAILKAVLLSGRSIVGEYDVVDDELYIDPVLNDHAVNNPLFNYLKMYNYLSIQELRNLGQFGEEEKNTMLPLLRVIRGEINNCSFTYKLTVEDKLVWIRINAQAHKINKEGQPSKVICYITDLTEEKRLEEKLQQARDESRRNEMEMQKAREADMLKSTFLANMSHEIRTPLNAIVGFSGIIAEMDTEEDKSEYVEIINKNCDLLLRLITDILDFSKIESGVMEYSLSDVNIKEICSEQYRIHSLKVQEGVTMVCDLAALPDVTLHTDPKRVTQIISNLLSNAIKFTEQGSITLSYTLKKDHILFEISDTGIGISAKHLESIFERFTKVDSFRQGTGLGLSICKTIVKALNGDIGVSSTPGKGSRFWFTLPY
ncbi:ATP-binding protein [Parabacteroides gordonii]|uniref:histidine kinase n=2 Tax=Parabacteroides gordonii TaxID=574930 RepID=A0A0F5JI40_9BACT|nr:ATP-binding protein [Parabacteroides gordonii]KKB57389.1 PAS domain S-box protein [Parabacteroides gordonii MS-1 = DSM 23371]MCA5582521.1 GAF domain-containing protein [Parabacteroides gordonii]